MGLEIEYNLLVRICLYAELALIIPTIYLSRDLYKEKLNTYELSKHLYGDKSSVEKPTFRKTLKNFLSLKVK